MKHKLLYFYTAACLALFSTINAQITIGSAHKSNSGSLLDLKQEADGSSKKGLGLPRVALQSLTGDLAQSLDGMATAGSLDKDEHVGLMVYNTSRIPDTDLCSPYLAISKGIHIWTGNEWQLIGEKEKEGTLVADKSGFVNSILKDYEGNEYTTRLYGTKRWMTQNLRSLRGADGNFIDCNNGVQFNPGYGKSASSPITGNIAKSSIPVGNNTYRENNIPITLTYNQFASKFGLLYNWEQANKACPSGWHLATKEEWEDLANIHFGSSLAGQYLKGENIMYTPSDHFSGYWNNHPEANNTSKFNAIPAGYRLGGDTAFFGVYTMFWAFDGDNMAVKGFSHASVMNLGYGGMTKEGSYHSIRCVKD